MTIKAVAIDPSLQNSNVATAAYVIQAGGTSINFGSGFAIGGGIDLEWQRGEHRRQPAAIDRPTGPTRPGASSGISR